MVRGGPDNLLVRVAKRQEAPPRAGPTGWPRLVQHVLRLRRQDNLLSWPPRSFCNAFLTQHTRRPRVPVVVVSPDRDREEPAQTIATPTTTSCTGNAMGPELPLGVRLKGMSTPQVFFSSSRTIDGPPFAAAGSDAESSIRSAGWLVPADSALSSWSCFWAGGASVLSFAAGRTSAKSRNGLAPR